MTPSSCTANSTSSPSLTCSACLIGSGRVSCAFWRSLARALVCGCGSFSTPASFKDAPGSELLGESDFLKRILAKDKGLRECQRIVRTTSDSRGPGCHKPCRPRMSLARWPKYWRNAWEK